MKKKNIRKFKVLPPKFNFKHAQVKAIFKSSFVKVGKRKVFNHPNTHIWDKTRCCFISVLTKPKRYPGEVREAKV